ncbi:DUF3592 domain-containing protein [Aeromicrobium wangtongii]|uniref:DUF3592 domain-containing protein n=1 Tax=Aeromicrobium wangtongii TaxID=2969247 RepID=UPI002017385A|nr:DUF3592 domain-containing protein [Aeromicrobium wangtongii]MCL3817432.1 DUF3592 domain-containing protein [Aeromicrobium wangtongii]
MSLIVLPLILLLAGGWLAGWGIRRRRAQPAVPDGWRRVVGTVIEVGDGVARPPRIQYRAPDGRRLRVPGPSATPLAVGDEIAVLLDPADYTRARLELTTLEGTRVVRLLIASGAVLLVIGAVGAVALR